jgi:CheY-like chemotaxis protein
MEAAKFNRNIILPIAPFRHRLFLYTPSRISFDSALILKCVELKRFSIFSPVGNRFAYPWARWKGLEIMARILIIDDDGEMRSLLKEFFEGEGFETDEVSNGLDGLKRLRKELFDFVITDIRMPGLTGLDILPGIRRLQPQAFVIAITAFGSEQVNRGSLERGATAYLEKPIHFSRLKKLIHEGVRYV